MYTASRARPPIAKPRRLNVVAVAIWVFAVIEAVGIGFVLTTY